MNTIVKKVDYLDSGLAASFCGSNFKAIDKSFLKEYKNAVYSCLKGLEGD